MFKYLLRRLWESLAILFAVLVLTFLLFNVASGDPAAAALGEKAQPQEIEQLRRELGADLPLFFGWECRTEVFPSFVCGSGKVPASIQFTGAEEKGEFYDLPVGCAMTVKRQFPGEGGFAVTFTGELHCGKQVFTSERKKHLVIPVAETVPSVTLYGPARIYGVAGVRLQVNPWNSQFRRAIYEVIHFTPDPPYVKCLDFGRSITTREPIAGILKRGVPPSLMLMLPVFFGELVLGIILALLAAAFKDSAIDQGLMIVSVAGISVSYLVVIIFAQWFLGYYYNFFPVWGFGGLRHFALPVLIGILCGLGGGVRFYRSVFVNELKSEYLRTARAKGCSTFRVYGKHLLSNAMIPIITRGTATLPFLFTGSLLLETFFGIPGLGYASVDALNNSDLQLLKALVIVSALLFIALNLIADWLCAWADPRIKLQ